MSSDPPQLPDGIGDHGCPRLWIAVAAVAVAAGLLVVSIRHSLSLQAPVSDAYEALPPLPESTAPGPPPEALERIAELEQKLAAEAGSGELVLDLAEAYLASGMAEEALQLLKGRGPGLPETSLLLGLALLGCGETDLAEKHLLLAYEAMPGSARPGVELYGLYRMTGRPTEANDIVIRTLERHPDDYDARIARADRLLSRLVVTEAVELLEGTIEIDPARPEAYALMSWALVSDEASARGYAQEALDRDPGSLQAWLTLGTLHAAHAHDRHHFQEAESAFLKVAELNPGYAEPHYQLGLLYRRAGRVPEAVQRLERGLELDPTYVACASALASTYAEAGRTEEAEALHTQVRLQRRFTDEEAGLRRAAEYEPDSAEAHGRVAEFYDRYGKHRLAAEWAESTLRLDPGNELASEILSRSESAIGDR